MDPAIPELHLKFAGAGGLHIPDGGLLSNGSMTVRKNGFRRIHPDSRRPAALLFRTDRIIPVDHVPETGGIHSLQLEPVDGGIFQSGFDGFAGESRGVVLTLDVDFSSFEVTRGTEFVFQHIDFSAFSSDNGIVLPTFVSMTVSAQKIVCGLPRPSSALFNLSISTFETSTSMRPAPRIHAPNSPFARSSPSPLTRQASSRATL